MVRVQQEPFDVGAELNAFSAGDTQIGAVASFSGLVRDMPPGDAPSDKISALTLEHYPGMTERKLEQIEAEAHERWQLTKTLIIHRYGRMLPGEPIVLVLAASTHRRAALQACAFLIDWLKTKAPFWKLEEKAEGEQWVEARASDDEAAGRW